jgi:polyhydroxyalkanoate synthesis regulator phasin
VESGRHQWDEIQEKMTETVRKGLDTFDIGSKREFQDLQKQVDNLEKRLAVLEKVTEE